MEEITKLHIAPAKKKYQQSIVYGPEFFFVVMIVGLLIFHCGSYQIITFHSFFCSF